MATLIFTAQATFEVAVIKANAEGRIALGNGVFVLSGRTHCRGVDTRVVEGDLIALPPLGRCSVRNSTLKEMINIAYDLQLGVVRSKVNQLIIGGPGWASSAPFDIDAKAEDAGVTGAQLIRMLQPLLAERFKLKFHREMRDIPAFTLTTARGGAKLKEAAPDEQTKVSLTPVFTGQRVGIRTIVDFISLRLNRMVIDKTGLTGSYDFTLTWTPDENEVGLNGAPARPTGDEPPGASLITAINEQLGLRLESQKIPTEVIVIDSAEMPNNPI